MKKCSYCGKEYPDDALVCAVDHEPLLTDGSKTPIPEESKQIEFPATDPSVGASGSMKCVASLGADMANELLARLTNEAITTNVQTVSREGELDYNDIMVEDRNYERACDIADAWQAEVSAKAQRRSQVYCRRCGSRHLEYIPTETFGRYIWMCKDCGNAFAG